VTTEKKDKKMNKKLVLISLLSFLALMSALQTARAATITTATLDKDTYLAGQTGYISVTIYNDKSDKIKVTELSATINYYYTDDTVYVQKFFTNATLPDEISAGQTETYHISISLPTNIAPGYTNFAVEAKTDLWISQGERWATSDRPTYQVKLYIESPYKEMYEGSQEQLQQQTAVNQNISNTVNMLAVTTIVLGAVAAFLVFFGFTMRVKPHPQL